MPATRKQSGVNLDSKFKRMDNFPFKGYLNVGRDSKADEMGGMGWINLQKKSNMTTKIISETPQEKTGSIYFTDNKMSGSNATAKQIAGFQEFGTPAHGPVTAKALRLKLKGSNKFIFRKWVKGIQGKEFFFLTDYCISNMKSFANEYIRKVFNA